MSTSFMDRAVDHRPEADVESFVTFQNSQGTELRGSPVRITRFMAVFEVYNPACVLQTSEALSDFQILLSGRPAYSGRAVVRSVVHGGAIIVCEATLEEGWLDVDLSAALLEPQLTEFLASWNKTFRIGQEYKLVIADMQSFLLELRLWLDQVELGIRSAPSGDRLLAEQRVIRELSQPILPAIDALFARFEQIAAGIDPELLPAHRAYMKRQLHPLVLSSPFAYRTFAKPLGYAGDYEMVNMIAREDSEGGSLFAKLVNLWFVRQPPAIAHRNRIEYLLETLICEAARVANKQPAVRVMNLGSGPAIEVQRFLAGHEVSSRADITLVDFNDETLRHVAEKINQVKARHNRSTKVQFLKKAVHQIVKESGRMISRNPDSQYDLVYCAGLFDYLSDQVCQRLGEILYSWVAPGGLLLITNVHPSNPLRNGMEHLLEWNLIHRDARQVAQFKPQSVLPDNFVIQSDLTGVNLFIATRKPDAA